jgi:hypothetical protein
MAKIARLRFPLGYRRATRTTNLLEKILYMPLSRQTMPSSGITCRTSCTIVERGPWQGTGDFPGSP